MKRRMRDDYITIRFDDGAKGLMFQMHVYANGAGCCDTFINCIVINTM